MRPDPLLHDVRYLPYLPLIHLAWADGVLSEAELEHVRGLASKELAPGIDDQPVLARWLDPEAPPAAEDLVRLRARMREAARSLPLAERRGLAALGLGLSRAEGAAPMESVARAVQQLERALGVVGDEATRALLEDIGLADTAAPAPEAPTAPFDLGDLTRLLDGRHHASRARLRGLLASGRLRHVSKDVSRSEHRAWVLEQLGVLAEEGVGAWAYPDVMGASEDIGAFIAAFEVLASGDLSVLVKFGVQFGLFGGSLYFLGTERHHALLPEVAALELPGCFAMTETGHGSNVRSLGTTARFDRARGGFVVHTPDRDSWKDYIGNAALHGRTAVTFARLLIDEEDYGVHPFLVPLRDREGRTLPGVRIEDCGPKLGLNGVDNGRIAFDQVFIPRENLLDRYAQVDAEGRYTSPINSAGRRFFTMIGTLVGGRVSVGAAAVGAARSALTIAIRYAARRRQFGPAGRPEQALLDYRTHQRRLMIPLAEAYALTFANRDLLERYVAKDEETGREVEALAAGIKSVSTWFATRTIQECREACGGAGYLAENRFAALKADTDVFTTFEGDNTVLMQLMAKGLLTRFASGLSQDRVFGVLRLIRDRASAELAELDPLTPRLTSREHLRSEAFQLDALRHREDKLTWSLAGRLRRKVNEGMDSFDAANECADHMLALARAATERHVVECFNRVLIHVSDAEMRRVLTQLRDLYALSRLETDQAWFLRHGVLEPAKARAIRDEVNALCADVRALALPLVEAFAIPEAALAATISAS
ncbi:MAG: acyl-CoA dehydrogenase family protein [Alphaproteobacteria bacterium]|nr:acyl-CoA dehydrogenase family protein [Alphaproteobacteria bacterium]